MMIGRFRIARVFGALVVLAVVLGACGTGAAQGVWQTPVNLGDAINDEEQNRAPDISSDGLTLYYCYHEGDIWQATRSSIGSPWGAPTILGDPPNTGSFEGSPCISSDNLTLYYFRIGALTGQDLWTVTRADTSDPWSNATKLDSPINTDYKDGKCDISSDGLLLVFTSDRPGGYGIEDLYMCTRESVEDLWSDPVNLGSDVNTSAYDGGPTLTADGTTLYFASAREGGYGAFDIYRTTWEDGWWTPAVNLGPVINTEWHDEAPSISADGTELYFASGRPGGSGGRDIWMATLIPEPCTLVLVVAGVGAIALRLRRRATAA